REEIAQALRPEPSPSAAAAAAAARTVAAVQAPVAPPVKKVEIEYVVKPNDTLGLIFTQLKLDVTDLPAILSPSVVHEKFKPLKPGDKLTLALENGVLRGVDRRISETE